MLTLRLIQTALGKDRYQAMLSLDNGVPTTAQFSFSLSAQDQEDLRWYLEDYLENPLDPAPKIAVRVEDKMSELGAQLFKDVFYTNDTARDMATFVRQNIANLRVEILTDIKSATAIPWELLRDSLTDVPLALRAQAFVRVQSDVTTPRLNYAIAYGADKIRILLVICRPRGGADVPFRSVASRIVRALSEDSREIVQLDVLRPPTFEQLAEVLRDAKRRGVPYHILHFDGHGIYAELVPEGAMDAEASQEQNDWLQEILKQLNVITLGAPRAGKHGYLLFENPQIRENMALVDGPALGNLMVETNVPVLVLNACQSAYAEAAERPRAASDVADAGSVQEQVRAFGSFEQEVMNTGVAGIVAMRYVLYVETAKQFVADLYSALLRGDTLGEAVTFGRKQLQSNPLREIAQRPIELQDWAVPIVYEAAPIQLFPRVGVDGRASIQITLDASEKTVQGLPPPPDAGFFGRDETLYALDRAFDSESIVLLHAYAGSGKTTTAAEFARWYLETGGLALSQAEGARGVVLFTSFEQYKPLARVLDAFGAVFGDMLERQANIHWLGMSDEERREVALQVMAQIPVLWLWDNVEPIAGFPTGTNSASSADEQNELREFLRAARSTRVKFLLTSRRDEHAWLGDLPRRLTLPPMPMQERWQLARALAEHQGRRAEQMENWKPLLLFSQGNPMTITVLVGQALRDNLKTRDEIDNFVAKLRAGQAQFDDDASQGRSKSLGASLAYGFESAFNDDERKILALLHFFQGFVNVYALIGMGTLITVSGEDFSLPEVRGLTLERGIALLDQAVGIGLLDGRNGFYYIHPALPWYFNSLFKKYYMKDSTVESNQSPTPLPSAKRSFVESMAALGIYYQQGYESGHRDMIALLELEEPNLLHAWQLARTNGWWRALTFTMQGLRSLYHQRGRRSEWARLVNEIVPEFVDPATNGPREGREEVWSLVTEYRVRLAMEAREWEQAEPLALKQVEWHRQRAAEALAGPLATLSDMQKNEIRSLVVFLQLLGYLKMKQSKPECIISFEEAYALSSRIADMSAGATAFNLGHAFEDIPLLRDLAKAELWYKRSLEIFDERDKLSRGKALCQLGSVGYARFEEAQ